MMVDLTNKRVRRPDPRWLTILGLVITLIGAGFGTYGVWVSEDQAIERGVSRWSGGTREDQLKLPTVQNLISQSRYAVLGFVLIGVGTLLQIAAMSTNRGSDKPTKTKNLEAEAECRGSGGKTVDRV